MPELPGSGCVVANISAAAMVAEVPEIAASAVLVPSEELPVGSDVVKVRILNHLLVVRTGLWIRIHFFRIRIQSMMLETNTDPDPDPIRIQGFNDQKLKKNYS